MRMPRGSKLDRLIRFPVEWNQFYLRMEEEKRLPELLEALQELPESSVRDVRIARIYLRMGKQKEAQDLVYQHRKCLLARSWYFVILMKNADENTLRKFVDSFRPVASLGGNILNLEAYYNDCMTLAASAHALKKIKLADEMYFEALQIAKILKDRNAERIVIYNMAWMRLYEGQLQESRSTFEQILKTTRSQQAIHGYALEYLSYIAWLTGDIPPSLSPEVQQVVHLLRAEQPKPSGLVLPEGSGLVRMLALLEDLRALTRAFHLRLPLLHVQENRAVRDGLIERIVQAVGQPSEEMLGFVRTATLSLALSMQHQPEALQVLRTGFRWPSTGIPVLGMLYFATLIQVQANLPHAPMDIAEVRRAFNTLVSQFGHLPMGQQKWLMVWMRDFTPITLYLLAEKWQVHPQPHDFVVVKPQGVYRGNESVTKYPRFFMVRHVQDLLSGHKVPDSNRKQAYRHVEALQAIGSPLVVYEPVVQAFRQLLH